MESDEMTILHNRAECISTLLRKVFGMEGGNMNFKQLINHLRPTWRGKQKLEVRFLLLGLLCLIWNNGDAQTVGATREKILESYVGQVGCEIVYSKESSMQISCRSSCWLPSAGDTSCTSIRTYVFVEGNCTEFSLEIEGELFFEMNNQLIDAGFKDMGRGEFPVLDCLHGDYKWRNVIATRYEKTKENRVIETWLYKSVDCDRGQICVVYSHFK